MILKAFDFWRIVPSRSAGDFPIENSPAASWTRPVGLGFGIASYPGIILDHTINRMIERDQQRSSPAMISASTRMAVLIRAAPYRRISPTKFLLELIVLGD